MAKAFSELGLVVGVQWLAERLLYDWARRDFRRLFLYCYTAQAFQDTPFSLPFTFHWTLDKGVVLGRKASASTQSHLHFDQ